MKSILLVLIAPSMIMCMESNSPKLGHVQEFDQYATFKYFPNELKHEIALMEWENAIESLHAKRDRMVRKRRYKKSSIDGIEYCATEMSINFLFLKKSLPTIDETPQKLKNK